MALLEIYYLIYLYLFIHKLMKISYCSLSNHEDYFHKKMLTSVLLETQDRGQWNISHHWAVIQKPAQIYHQYGIIQKIHSVSVLQNK